MTQKLVILERDTKKELEKAIKKHLEDSNFQVKGLSVLEQVNQVTMKGEEGIFQDPDGETHFEAWIIIEDYPIVGLE